jgi:hypothetical protein
VIFFYIAIITAHPVASVSHRTLLTGCMAPSVFPLKSVEIRGVLNGGIVCENTITTNLTEDLSSGEWYMCVRSIAYLMTFYPIRNNFRGLPERELHNYSSGKLIEHQEVLTMSSNLVTTNETILMPLVTFCMPHSETGVINLDPVWFHVNSPSDKLELYIVHTFSQEKFNFACSLSANVLLMKVK